MNCSYKHGVIYFARFTGNPWSTVLSQKREHPSIYLDSPWPAACEAPRGG